MLGRTIVALSAALCFGSVPGAAQSFTIQSAVIVGRTEVRYFLAGPFGGYGGFVRDASMDGAYQIPLTRDGKAATSLKGIVYASGCQFEIFSVDLTTDPKRNALIECRPLPTTTVRGRISPPNDVGLDVQISYLSRWDHAFFGITDGIVQSFSLENARLEGDGRFQIQIPDFSKDRVTSEMHDAYLNVAIVEHATANVMGRVLPLANLQYGKMGLAILPQYDSEIDFTAGR